jgi:hypothetical protein
LKKLTIAAILIFLVVIMALGCSGSNTNKAMPSQDGGNANKTTASQPEQTATNTTPAPTAYKVGDRVVVGDRAYTITNVKTTAFVGDEYSKQTATGVFVIVSMNIENLGKESATMSTNDIKIVDSQGRTFESDSNAWATLKDNILLKQIQPGLPIKGETIFDVPKGIDAALQVTDGGFTTEPVNISLGKIQ